MKSNPGLSKNKLLKKQKHSTMPSAADIRICTCFVKTPCVFVFCFCIFFSENSIFPKKKTEKFYNAEYGRCPRVFCKDQPVLPAAISDIPHEEAVKVCTDRHTRTHIHTHTYTQIHTHTHSLSRVRALSLWLLSPTPP